MSELPPKSICLTNITDNELKNWSAKLICVLGPTGVGKTALCQEIIKMFPQQFSMIGCTTTRQRSQKDIKENILRVISSDEFIKLIQKDSFFYWQQTPNGFYGLEKESIRKAIGFGKKHFIVFRSKSGIDLKRILKKMLVIELRADINVIEKRLKYRKRKEARSIEKELLVAKSDLEDNNKMFKSLKFSKQGYWYQIENNIDEPPISPKVVHKAMQFINSETLKICTQQRNYRCYDS